MKIILFASTIFTAVVSIGLFSQELPTDLQGVWFYEIEGIEAIGIFSPTHSAWIGLKNNRKNLHGKTVTIEDKAEAFDAMWDIGITSCTLEEPGRVKSTFINSHLPSKIGQNFSWDFEIKDGYFYYWIIKPDGSRGYSGKARKMADWNAPSPLASMNGLWQYQDGAQGHFLMCGNYCIWFWGDNKHLPAPTSAEDKARIFDSFSSTAAIAQKKENSGEGFGDILWHNLISSDIRNEKKIESTRSIKIADDTYETSMLNAQGSPTGQKWTVKRIK